METIGKLRDHQITPMCVEEIVDDLVTMESMKNHG